MPRLNRRPGQVVVLQEVWDERVWAARPVRVVRDDDDLVVLWFPRGTRWMSPTTPPHREREPTRAERSATSLQLVDWELTEAEWDVDTLKLMRPGDWHATWVSWLPTGEHWGWYVNIQRPFERTSLGFRTMDLVLDVVFERDLTWRYKDEDELEVFRRRGVFDGELDRRIRDEARSAIATAAARTSPFSDPWPDWRPDVNWTLPELPDCWDQVADTIGVRHQPGVQTCR